MIFDIIQKSLPCTEEKLLSLWLLGNVDFSTLKDLKTNLTPLMYAICFGREEMARFLAAHSKDLLGVDSNISQETVLHKAAKRGSVLLGSTFYAQGAIQPRIKTPKVRPP